MTAASSKALPRGPRIKRVLPATPADQVQALNSQLQTLSDQLSTHENNQPQKYWRQTVKSAKETAEKGQVLLALKALINKAQSLADQTQAEMAKKRPPLDPKDIDYLLSKL